MSGEKRYYICSIFFYYYYYYYYSRFSTLTGSIIFLFNVFGIQRPCVYAYVCLRDAGTGNGFLRLLCQTESFVTNGSKYKIFSSEGSPKIMQSDWLFSSFCNENFDGENPLSCQKLRMDRSRYNPLSLHVCMATCS